MDGLIQGSTFLKNLNSCMPWRIHIDTNRQKSQESEKIMRSFRPPVSYF